jgi:hypothetical protein
LMRLIAVTNFWKQKMVFLVMRMIAIRINFFVISNFLLDRHKNLW